MSTSNLPRMSMSGRTTADAGHRHAPLSRTALAARSLIAADRLKASGDIQGYRVAMANHAREFGPARTCDLRRF